MIARPGGLEDGLYPPKPSYSMKHEAAVLTAHKLVVVAKPDAYKTSFLLNSAKFCQTDVAKVKPRGTIPIFRSDIIFYWDVESERDLG